jgi:mono/diheme cytochrome c family protein
MSKTAQSAKRSARSNLIAVVAILLFAPENTRADTVIQRGSYLVNTILACGNCHTPRDSSAALIQQNELSGGLTISTPAFVATAPNITPDRATGIGDWSDAEIKRALTEGVRPDHGRLPGVALAAVMPAGFYEALLPEDLDATVAYLKTVNPVRHAVPEPEYRSSPHREAYPEAEKGFTASDLSDSVRHGAYLVTIGHCMECHSAWTAGIPDYAGGLGRGGRPFGPKLIRGFAATWQGSVAPNITSDLKKGIGAWTDEEIVRAIREGVARDGRHLGPPMAVQFYSGLSDHDVYDTVAYLRTLN